MSFMTWTTVEYKTYKPREQKRIAAVDKDTEQIVHIYNSCYEAARSTIQTLYFTFNPSPELVREAAKQIAEATAKYHKEVLGYYWKRIY